jgi:hypothetical protein
MYFYKETVKCPAEESVNSRKSPPTNERKNSEKTDTRTNKPEYGDDIPRRTG